MLTPIFFLIDSDLVTKGTILSSFSLFHLMLIIGKGCAMNKIIQKVQRFLRDRLIPHENLFQFVLAEQFAHSNYRDIIVV